ncbi:MAG: site-specific integrase, partial [Methanomicrobiales archaeon]|nr:site-specific integrase [Methanomicrobiales archaeon]
MSVYLKTLERAGRSRETIKTYNNAFLGFARYLDVPLEELHLHVSGDNPDAVEKLMDYLDSEHMKKVSANSRRTYLAAISRFMRINGVVFDELDMEVVKTRKTEERDDKPLELETLQRMMDLADVRMKAVLTFWISTGCRIGETSKLLLSDVRGNIVNVRPEIAKGRRGGKVFLNEEAAEYLQIWLNCRDEWIRDADTRARNMRQTRPDKDERLFASSYSSLSQAFGSLYDAVDGETVRTLRGDRQKVTPHSCRAYFRTHGAKTMGIDLVEGIMRHTGYLNAAYVRMSETDRERQYRAGESILYITRPNQREYKNEIAIIKQEKDQEIAVLKEQMQAIQDKIAHETQLREDVERDPSFLA